MLEKLLAAEVLEVRVLHPAIAQSLVGKVISVLEDRQPRHQPRRQRRLARLVGVDRPNVCSRKRQSIVRASFTNACFISMIWSSRERNRSCSLVSRRSRGRIANPPLHQLEREESRLAIRGNPQIRFARKSPSKAKTGKFDYLSGPNHSALSIAFKFFTDDALSAPSSFQLARHPRDH